ncbi:MAG: hypothetical protein K2X11_02565 [Acetobacteraceae bacterium]|nr:hypothetical protein [Acetobacteraceae bacterium]
MALFLVTYDLRKEGQDYGPLIKRLHELGAQRVLLSTWLLPQRTGGGDVAVAIRNDLGRYLDNNDRFLAIEVKNAAAWHRCEMGDLDLKALIERNAAP